MNNKKSAVSCAKDDDAEYALSWYHLDFSQALLRLIVAR